VLLPQLVERARVERALPRARLVEHQTKREQVALHAVRAPLEKLRCHVHQRAGQLPGRHLPRQARHAEVGDAHAAVAVEHDVGRLEVAVQHAAVVDRRQPGAQLPRDVERLAAREAADPPQQPGQVLPVHVLHG
jgi:hypothetical protein